MTEKNKQIIYVKTKQVVPDAEQPRRNFDARKLAILADSIKQEGILDPLKVEQLENDKYLLIDGERRYRASVIAGIPEVPVIVMENMSLGEKMIKQFHIQETHEGWTAPERAMALSLVSKEMGIKNHNELAKSLGLSQRTVRSYVQFGKIINQDKFIKTEVPIEFVEHIPSLVSKAKKVYQDSYSKEFTESKKKDFEGKIMELIKSGAIKTTGDISKVKDAISRKPAMVEEIIKGLGKDVTAQTLFFKAEAQSAYHLRNLKNHMGYAETHMNSYLKLPNRVAIDRETFFVITRLVEKLTLLAKMYDKDYQ